MDNFPFYIGVGPGIEAPAYTTPVGTLGLGLNYWDGTESDGILLAMYNASYIGSRTYNLNLGGVAGSSEGE